VRKVVFSPDGRTLAAVSASSTRLWDAASGTLVGHTSLVTAAAFALDGAVLVTAAADNTVRLWDVATAVPRGAPLVGHRDVVFALAVSPDGRTPASGSWDTTTRVWDVATGAPRREIGGHSSSVSALAFSPDGTTLAVASSDPPSAYTRWSRAARSRFCAGTPHR
jgi:WD40 repeat protein